MKTRWLPLFAVLALASGTTFCAPVVLSGSGTLSSAFGAFTVGDPFSFVGDYDDAAAPLDTSERTTLFPPFSRLTFIVDGIAFHPEVLFDTAFDGRTLGVSTPADYFLHTALVLAVNRADLSSLTLPTMMEVAGRSGTFDFFEPGLLASGGTGAFTIVAASVPEAPVGALVLLGTAAMAAAGRAKRKARRRSEASAAVV